MRKIVLLLSIPILFTACHKYYHLGDSNTIESSLKERTDIIFYGGFEEEYNNHLWKERWGIKYIERGEQSRIVENGLDDSKSL